MKELILNAIPWAALAVFAYTMVLDPLKRLIRQRKFQKTLQPGTLVRTIGGIIGYVERVNGGEVILSTGSKFETSITVAKSHISAEPL